MGSRAEGMHTDAPVPEEGADAGEVVDDGVRPDWWHREHPVFVPLISFYAGLLGLTLLPALYVALLRSMMSFEEAERWFWPVGLLLLVPLGMLLNRHSRRAGAFVLLGMATAVVVVGGVAALVLWVLMR